MKYFFNAYDIKRYFNTEILNATSEYMQLPERKKSVTNNFEDENGQDIDLVAPKFDARVFNFNCVTKGETIPIFKEKYFALFNLLKIDGRYSVYNDFLDMTLFLFFVKQTNVSNMYKTAEGFAMTHTLVFGETNPFDNIPMVTLVDDEFNVLIP